MPEQNCTQSYHAYPRQSVYGCQAIFWEKEKKKMRGRNVEALPDGPVWSHTPAPGWEELPTSSPLPSPSPNPQNLAEQGSQAQGRRKDTPTGK